MAEKYSIYQRSISSEGENREFLNMQQQINKPDPQKHKNQRINNEAMLPRAELLN
jgi:hypothetical protein